MVLVNAVLFGTFWAEPRVWSATTTTSESTSSQNAASAPLELTLGDADNGRTVTLSVGSVIHVRLGAPWREPVSGDTSVLRTDDSSGPDADGKSDGDFTAVASGNTDIQSLAQCSNSPVAACTPAMWRAIVNVVPSRLARTGSSSLLLVPARAHAGRVRLSGCVVKPAKTDESADLNVTIP